MAFVLVLILSMSLLVRVETEVAETNRDRLLARENARLGLMIGIGNLQKLAGPDRRVTYRSEALNTAGASINNLHWTGVFDPTTSGTDWLVSQPSAGAADPTTLLTDSNSIEIVRSRTPSGAGTADLAVRVPIRDIEDNLNQYAYWISDESIKASLATRPHIDGQTSDWLDESYGGLAQRLDQVVPKSTGADMVFTRKEGFATNQVLVDFGKTNSTEQLGLNTQWDMALAYDNDFHAFTARSYGVLASTTGTGLKSDLSLSPGAIPISGAFSTVADFATYMETPAQVFDTAQPHLPYQGGLRRRYNITAPTNRIAGQIGDGVYPIITDFKIALNVHVANPNIATAVPEINLGDVVIRAQVHVELWNPYTSAIVPENLVLQIDNLPTVTIELLDDSGISIQSANIDLSTELENVPATPGSSTTGSYFIELPFTDLTWLPGRIYNWLGPNNYAKGTTTSNTEGVAGSRNILERIWYEGTGISALNGGNYYDYTSYSTQLTSAATNISISLRQKGAEDRLDDGSLLYTIAGINFGAFTSVTAGINKSASRFGYHIIRDDNTAGTDAWINSRWLRVEDPRAVDPGFDPTGAGSSAFLPSEPGTTDPGQYASSQIAVPSSIFDRSGTSLGPSEDVPLFELFRHRPLSVGELQHLKINGRRPFTIGNSWASKGGDRFNRVFDESFFSGLAGSDSSPLTNEGEALPNHRLRPVAELTGGPLPDLDTITDKGANSSELLMVEGAFNLNSTSHQAWAAMLGSIYLQNWQVANIQNDTGEIDPTEPTRNVPLLGQSILRFPQSAQEVFHTDSTSPPNDTNYFRVGAKSFGGARQLTRPSCKCDGNPRHRIH